MTDDQLRHQYLLSFESPHIHWTFIYEIYKKGQIDDLLRVALDYHTTLSNSLIPSRDITANNIAMYISGQLRSKSRYEIYNLIGGTVIAVSSVPREYATESIYYFYSNLLPALSNTFSVHKFENGDFLNLILILPIPEPDDDARKFRCLSGHKSLREDDSHFINLGIRSSSLNSKQLSDITHAIRWKDFSQVSPHITELLLKETGFNTRTGMNDFLCELLHQRGLYDERKQKENTD